MALVRVSQEPRFAWRAVAKRPWLLISVIGGILLACLMLWAGSWLIRPSPGNGLATSPVDRIRRASPLDLLEPARIKHLPPTERPEGSVAVLSGHRLAESYLKFSPDGKLLAACGDSTSPNPVLWHMAGPEPRIWAKCEGHKSVVSAVAFSPDSKFLASVGGEKIVRLWDLTGAQPKEIGRASCRERV